MTVLPNPRHERFAQELATGKSADAAYVDAGYKPNRHNAAALGREEHISTRVAELQSLAAKHTLVTIESLTDELEEARAIAVADRQSSAAVAATMGKAKLHGLIVDRKQHSGPNGGPIPVATVDLTNMTEEQLAALETVFGPLAGGSGDDDEGDPSGEEAQG